jgi:alcohol dehydrogenase
MLAPFGVLSSVGVYSGHLTIPAEQLHAGLADQTIVTTLCPGGKARLHRLMQLVAAGRIDLRPLLTLVFDLDKIAKAYQVFGSGAQGVLKVAIRVP